jgi:hypothetical protein
MVSNIRTNSSGLISTPLVAGVVVHHDHNPDRIANAEKMLKDIAFPKASSATPARLSPRRRRPVARSAHAASFLRS